MQTEERLKILSKELSERASGVTWIISCILMVAVVYSISILFPSTAMLVFLCVVVMLVSTQSKLTSSPHLSIKLGFFRKRLKSMNQQQQKLEKRKQSMHDLLEQFEPSDRNHLPGVLSIFEPLKKHLVEKTKIPQRTLEHYFHQSFIGHGAQIPVHDYHKIVQGIYNLHLSDNATILLAHIKSNKAYDVIIESGLAASELIKTKRDSADLCLIKHLCVIGLVGIHLQQQNGKYHADPLIDSCKQFFGDVLRCEPMTQLEASAKTIHATLFQCDASKRIQKLKLKTQREEKEEAVVYENDFVHISDKDYKRVAC